MSWHLTEKPYIAREECFGDSGLTLGNDWCVWVQYYPTDPFEEMYLRTNVLLFPTFKEAVRGALQILERHDPECPEGLVCEGHTWP